MVHLVLDSPKVRTDYFFFAGKYEHNDVFYKAAVMECLALDAATGSYEVMLVSDNGVQRMHLTRGENGWQPERKVQGVDQGIIDLIGADIDNLRK